MANGDNSEVEYEVIAPDGTQGSVSAADRANVSGGYKLTGRVKMYAPDGTAGFVEPQHMADATHAGYTVTPVTQFEQQNTATHPVAREAALGTFAGLGVPETMQPVTDMAKGMVNTFAAPPQGTDEKIANAILPLSAYRMAKGFIGQIGQGAKDVYQGIGGWRGIESQARYELGLPMDVSGPEPNLERLGHGAAELGTIVAVTALPFLKGAKAAPVEEAAAEAPTPKAAPEPSATAGTAEQKGPASSGGMMEKLGISDPPPNSLMTRAVKPLASNTGWDAAIKKAMPDMKAAEADLGHPIQGVDDALSAVNTAKKKIWAQYSQKLSQANARPDANMISNSPASMSSETPFAGAGGATIDGNTIADAMVNSIDRRTALQNPSLVKQISSIADTYRRPLSLDEAEDFLQSANNDLNSYYAKNKVGRQVAQRDASTGYIVAEADALRDGLYSKLDEVTGPGARELKQRYGALSNVENELLRRRNVAARQQPVSLAEQIAMSGGVGGVGDIFRPDKLINRAQNVAVARWLKNYGSTDAMITRAFAKLDGGATAAPSAPARSSVLPRVAAAAATRSGFKTNSDIFDEGKQMYQQAHPRL